MEPFLLIPSIPFINNGETDASLLIAILVNKYFYKKKCNWADFSLWTHCAISCSSQFSMTGVTMAVVCASPSVEWCIQKISLTLTVNQQN